LERISQGIHRLLDPIENAVPAELCAVVERAMHHDVNQRYARGQDLANALYPIFQAEQAHEAVLSRYLQQLFPGIRGTDPEIVIKKIPIPTTADKQSTEEPVTTPIDSHSSIAHELGAEILQVERSEEPTHTHTSALPPASYTLYWILLFVVLLAMVLLLF
jgi:hypothetical protein